MSDTTLVTPGRGMVSVAVLIGLVLAVTAQLVTGFALMAHARNSLLTAHIIGGVCAIVLTVAEWAWLAGTQAGRLKLRRFFAPGSGPADWSEAVFLAAVTITVILGALLAAAMHGSLRLPYGAMLTTHRGLAIAVAVFYLLHSSLAARHSRMKELGQ